MWVRPLGRGGARRARDLGAAPARVAGRSAEPCRVPTRGGRHRPRHGRPADERVGTWVGTNPLTVTATIPHIVLRCRRRDRDLAGRHRRHGRTSFCSAVTGCVIAARPGIRSTAWLFAGCRARRGWRSSRRASTSSTGRLPGRDVVSALLLLATVPLLVAGAMVEALRRSSSGLEQTSHRGPRVGAAGGRHRGRVHRSRRRAREPCSARTVRRGSSSPRPARSH